MNASSFAQMSAVAKSLSVFCVAGTLFAAPLAGADTGATQADERVSTTTTENAANTTQRAIPSQTTSTTATNRASTETIATDEEAMYFTKVDINNDYRVEWQEISNAYPREINEFGWERDEFLDEFDTDGDQFLDEDEYSEFISEVGLEEPENRSSFMDIDVK